MIEYIFPIFNSSTGHRTFSCQQFFLFKKVLKGPRVTNYTFQNTNPSNTVKISAITETLKM